MDIIKRQSRLGDVYEKKDIDSEFDNITKTINNMGFAFDNKTKSISIPTVPGTFVFQNIVVTVKSFSLNDVVNKLLTITNLPKGNFLAFVFVNVRTAFGSDNKISFKAGSNIIIDSTLIDLTSVGVSQQLVMNLYDSDTSISAIFSGITGKGSGYIITWILK